MKTIYGDLDKVTAAKTDKAFLTKLSRWLFALSGNVNVAQRLTVIALRGVRNEPRQDRQGPTRQA